jgi:putative restriction endonuclease
MLMDYWGGRCAVTGLDVPELLRASHAKPWKDCDDRERLDVYNGLLLAVHLDALFDRGLMTFDSAGTACVSVELPRTALESLIPQAVHLRIRRLTDAHQLYLAYHRQHVFRAPSHPPGADPEVSNADTPT